MDYRKRQGNRKLKVSLTQMRHWDFFSEIDQPDVVYHMTDRENLNDILNDGKIKSFNDYVTYFFPDTKCIPVYCAITGAFIGRTYSTTDGKQVTAPPLNIEQTVVLKLIPRRPEKLEWYKEVSKNDVLAKRDGLTKEMEQVTQYFDNARIVHYGDFAFKSDSVEVIELKDIMNEIDDETEELIRIVKELQEKIKEQVKR